ncbi:hypothetical protein [Arthrobacter sp. ZGTC412]|uniref:hypothetical protein n=1 Tax=Arthrobacter sp. ZGTC412 TaxID=2058900 RepID=UPI000CE5592B|nr:hypothetical protein [Arthrobacter sp. ZGTC412]
MNSGPNNPQNPAEGNTDGNGRHQGKAFWAAAILLPPALLLWGVWMLLTANYLLGGPVRLRCHGLSGLLRGQAPTWPPSAKTLTDQVRSVVVKRSRSLFPTARKGAVINASPLIHRVIHADARVHPLQALQRGRLLDSCSKG